MKRCPQCDSVFEEVYRFCDLDGTPLINDEPPESSGHHQPAPNWKILAIGGIVGLAMGVVLYVVYHAFTRPSSSESAETSANAGIAQSFPPVTLNAETSVASSPSPTSEPSPSPSPAASPTASRSPQPSPTVQLSSSPISTGTADDTRVRIRLHNGATIEADEAWKGPEGIWYRHRGVVALLDPAQVKSVERPPPALKPSASPTP